MRRLVLALLLAAPLGCQEINYDAVGGVHQARGGAGGGEGAGGGPGGAGRGEGEREDEPDRGAPAVDAGRAGPPDAAPPGAARERPPRCEAVTARAYGIVKEDC